MLLSLRFDQLCWLGGTPLVQAVVHCLYYAAWNIRRIMQGDASITRGSFDLHGSSARSHLAKFYNVYLSRSCYSSDPKSRPEYLVGVAHDKVLSARMLRVLDRTIAMSFGLSLVNGHFLQAA
jgi:hypothetical protein